MHALVIGGSLGGLLAASLLRQAGWEVTVFERSTGDLAGRGAGLGMSENLMEVLRRVGAHLDASSGAVMASRVWIDAHRTTRYEVHRTTFGSAWPRVYRPLRERVPDHVYRAGMTLTRVEQEADAVTAVFSDGTRVRGDLLVAADGNASTVRRQFLPQVQPRYCGYIAWRGIVEEREMSPQAQAMVFGRIVFSFPPGEMMLTMPSPGPGEDMRRGHRRCYFIWYRVIDAEQRRELFTGVNGERHDLAIPPPLIRPGFVREMKAIAPQIFAPELGEVVTLASQPLLQAISDMAAPKLVFGRVALIGDSAFLARPHVAAGATKAALDAQCLADELAATPADVEAALGRFERKQLEFGTRLAQHSRALGGWLLGASADTVPGGPNDAFRDPARIMREYGAPHLLRDVDVSHLAAAERSAGIQTNIEEQ